MISKNLQEINKYTNPQSFLVVASDGKLYRIKLPFKVRVLYPFGGRYNIHDILEVKKIKTDKAFRLIYVIHQNEYAHSKFEIL